MERRFWHPVDRVEYPFRAVRDSRDKQTVVHWPAGKSRLRPDVQPGCGASLPLGQIRDEGLYRRGSLPEPATAAHGGKRVRCFLLQKRLRQLDLYKHNPDGIFGYATEQAVKKFQQQAGLPVTGQVGWAEYKALRLLNEEY